MLLRYMHAGFTFRMPQPIITVEKKTNGQKVITAKSPIEAGTVRYTLDGSEPTAAASILKAPISVPANSIFKAVAVSPDGKRISLAYVQADGTGKYARHGKELGHWKSGKVASRKPQEISFDATGLIDSNGTYIITFIYTGGRERLDIHRVTIVKNDREQIAEDKHFGFTGGKAKDNQYKVTIKAYETGAAFKIVAWVCGDVGNDSNGVVLIRKAK